MDWLNELGGPNFAPAVLWTLLALVVLVIVLIVIRVVRSMTFGTFVAGGRNRKTRLAVMDAAAVDSARRLVLVRRDDVEHLILIGGPTDVVVERDIRLHATTRRPAPAAGEPPADAIQPRPRAAAAELPSQPARPERPGPQPVRPGEPRPAQPAAVATLQPVKPAAAPAPRPAPAPVRMPTASMPPQTPAAPARPAPAPVNSNPPAAPKLKPLDPAPVSDGTFGAPPKPRPRSELTLEDEMNRLLGELSNKKQ